MRGFPITPALLGAIFLAGCPIAGPPPEAPQDAQDAPPDPDGPAGAPRPRASAAIWSACYQGFEPTVDAPADLDRLTQACGPPTGLLPITPVQIGDPQREGQPAERFTFRARAGRCYRFFSVATPTVTDLDLAVFDAEGQLITADASPDRFPVVPPRGPLCAPADTVFTLEIAVTQGRGAYLLQVWAD